MGKLEFLLRILGKEIAVHRREYLKKIRFFRNNGRKIYYLDETWVNSERAGQSVWESNSATSCRQNFSSDLSKDLRDPSYKAKRLIVCHIGSTDGFVPEGMWIDLCFETVWLPRRNELQVV